MVSFILYIFYLSFKNQHTKFNNDGFSPTQLCELMDSSPPGCSVHGISQASILEWVAISSHRGSSKPRIKLAPPALAGRFFTTAPAGKSLKWYVTIQRGGMGWEVGRKFKKEGAYEQIQLIYVDVWQKPTQYCKSIILQIKIN